MTCPKCKSVMIPSGWYSDGQKCEGWRCLICGNYLDEAVIKNRRESLPRYVRARENKPKVAALWEVV